MLSSLLTIFRDWIFNLIKLFWHGSIRLGPANYYSCRQTRRSARSSSSAPNPTSRSTVMQSARRSGCPVLRSRRVHTTSRLSQNWSSLSVSRGMFKSGHGARKAHANKFTIVSTRLTPRSARLFSSSVFSRSTTASLCAWLRPPRRCWR